MFRLFIIISLFTSSWAFAGLTEDFEKIKNHGRSLEATGTICEEVAQLMFIEKYPEPKYQVITGVAYADNKNDIGELDLVIFNRETGIAEAIGEVKCWKSPKNGLDKAKDQRERFIRNVHSSKALKFRWLDDPSVKLTKTQFNKVTEFFSVGQQGTVSAGYDYELPYSLKELMTLRNEILRCQSFGTCKKP